MRAATMSGAERMRDRRSAGPDPRLEHLYAISKLLIRFQSVEKTLSDVVAIVARTLGLQSAIFILETAGPPRSILWRAPGCSPDRLLLAKVHAQTTYGYFVRSGVDLELDAADPLDLPRPEPEAEAATGTGRYFVILPLVDGKGTIFGALQLEGHSPWDEHHLAFMDAVVNQLAIAVDRQAIIIARQAAVEGAEREQRRLAEFSAIVGSCLEVQDILRAIATFAVPALADICVVDLASADGKALRMEVRFADDEKERTLAARVRRGALELGEVSPQARAMTSRESLLFSQLAMGDVAGIADPQGQAQERGGEELVPNLGITSMLVIPLVARGRTLGAVTMCAAESARRYSGHDLRRAEELIQRAAMALDNAQLYEQAQRATRARDNLLSIVSHDLKNYVTACLFSASALLEESKKDPRHTGQKQILVVQRSATKIDRLLNDLLQTARIEAGGLSLERQRVDPAVLIAEAVEALQPLATSKRQDLKSELPANLPAVSADAGRIQQVLTNLIGNAIKFTPAEGAITVGATCTGGEVVVTVADTGPGIAEEEVSHLFERFWQTKSTARLGTGLGLFIVKGIVEAHGGRVWFAGKSGPGSTFCFTLPLA